MNEPARQLVNLAGAAAWCQQAPNAGVQSIGQAMAGWLDGTGPTDLRDALGVRPGPGQHSAPTEAAIQRRNFILKKTWRKYFPNLEPVPAGEALGKALLRYSSGPDWRRDRTASEIPYRDTLRGHCWAILKAVDHTPKPDTIRKILASS